MPPPDGAVVQDAATALPPLGELEGWLAARESAVPGLRPDCGKRILWAGGPAQRTRRALVYVHGFSATWRELSPVPERVAQRLGANLFLTRLRGHGQDGAAMAAATLADWRADVAEALQVGRRIGEEVVVMGCSTGATLLALALADAAEGRDPETQRSLRGAIFVSPNFRLRSRLAGVLLDLPLAARWAPLLVGRERSFPAISDLHAAYWTTRYPTRALVPMAQALRAWRRRDPAAIGVPAIYACCAADAVVDTGYTRAVMARWGGGARFVPVSPGPGDDARGHLVAGDIFSPGQTDRLAEALSDWALALG